MGAELTAAAEVPPELRHRAGIAYPNPLAGNPDRSPTFARTVKRLDGSQLKVACPVATRLALACMNMNAVMGGAACHWGGPSAFAEMMSAIHALMFAADDWRQAFNFVNDAGHAENGIYALKANYGFAGLTFDDLKQFRSIESKLTGHGESHLFKDGVMVSNGPLGSGLPISQGLAMADALAAKSRVTLCAISDGGMMEGEAREAVAAIPGLASKGKLAPYVLLVSDNNTKLSGRIDEQSFSMQPSFEALDDLGWQVVRVADGHDLQAVTTAVEQAIADTRANPAKPVCLWLKTIKGFGVEKTEQSSSGGHGYPLKTADDLRAFCLEIARRGHDMDHLPPLFEAWVSEIEATARAKAEAAAAAPKANKPKTAKIQAGFPQAMIAAAKNGVPVVSLSADLPGSTGIAPFHAEFPQFSFELGIAESNMVSAAAGFSKQGYVPVVDTFAQFGTTKGALPLTMGQLSQSGCIGVFTHIGFQDAADGASHQSLTWLALSSAIPGVVAYCPATSEEAEWAMAEAIRRFAAARAAGEEPETVLFFCGRENFPLSLKPEGVDYQWGSAMTVADTTAGKGRSVVISANASLVFSALKAVEELETAGIGAVLLNNATPNRPDVAAHQAALARCGGNLVTVEEHQATGGAGSMLATALVGAGVAFQHRLLAVKGVFGQSAYQASELYDLHGIGPAGMVAAAKTLVG